MSVPARWSSEKVYFESDDFFHDMLACIDSAQDSVLMETYIFERGLLANRMCSALSRAAQRGVRVRLLVDGIGSPGFGSEYETKMVGAGVEVQYYRLWPWIFRRMAGEPKGWAWQLFYRFEKLNKG